MYQMPYLAPGQVIRRCYRRWTQTLYPALPQPAGKGLVRRPKSDTVQPARQRPGLANRPAVDRQDQKGGLERILGVRVVPQYAPAHVQHHRTVAAQEGGERRLVLFGPKAVQQLPVLTVA